MPTKKQTIESAERATRKHLPLTAEERLTLLKGIRGMWKHPKRNRVEELEEIRNGWDRELPPLN